MSTRSSITFFAHHGDAFAERLRTSPESLIRQVETWAQAKRIKANQLQRGIKYVRSICIDSIGQVRSSGYFIALCWIGDALMEKIPMPDFSELNSYSFIAEYGVVPGLLQHPAPYPLPWVNDPPPAAGYLPWTKMNAFSFAEVSEAEHLISDLLTSQAEALYSELGRQLLGKDLDVPPRIDISRDKVNYVRQEFRYMLDTLVEDKLDLLVVIE